MSVETHTISVSTQGNSHVVNISDHVLQSLAKGSITDGIVCVFVVGSTAGITTTEYEPGLAGTDLKAMFENIAPENAHYVHEQTWHDDNGHSHCRASLLGPSITVPLINRKLALGTWQQIILLDFDTSSRDRQILIQVIGEKE